MKTTKAERDKLRAVLDDRPGVAWVPVDGGLLKELLDENERLEAELAQVRAILCATRTLVWQLEKDQ